VRTEHLLQPGILRPIPPCHASILRPCTQCTAQARPETTSPCHGVDVKVAQPHHPPILCLESSIGQQRALDAQHVQDSLQPHANTPVHSWCDEQHTTHNTQHTRTGTFIALSL